MMRCNGRALSGLMLLSITALLTLSACDLFVTADKRVARAERNMAQHEYRTAIIELKNALQDEPAHVTARVRLAEAEFMVGDLAAADKDLRRARELGAEAAATGELDAQLGLLLGSPAALLARLDQGDLRLQGATLARYRGETLMYLRRYPEAIELLRSVAADDPHWAGAQLTLARALAGQGSVDEASTVLQKLIEARPQYAEARGARAALLAQRNDLEGAERDLEQARALDFSALPMIERIRLLAALTEIQLARGNARAAGATGAELAKIAPESLMTHLLAARVAMADRDFARAAAILQRTVQTAPDVMQARFLLGAALLAQGNIGQAEQQLSEVLQRSPENVEARKLLAQVRLRLGRPDAALQALTAVPGGEDAQADFLQGIARMQSGDVGAGVTQMERAVAARPRDVTLRMDLASAYLATGAAAKAVTLLSRDVGAPAARESALLAQALLVSGNEAQALEVIHKMLARHPRAASALDWAAAFFMQRGDLAQARELSQRAVEAEPQNRAALLARAEIEVQAGDLSAAKQWLQKAAALGDSDGTVNTAMADISVREGDLKSAITTLEAQRARDTRDVGARLRLAALYARQRDSKSFDGVAGELVKLGKEQPTALSGLGSLYLDSGRFDEALATFQQAVQADPARPANWLNVGRAQMALGNIAAARQSAERANTVRPGWLPAVGNLALLDVRDGHSERAIARITELRSRNAKDAAVLAFDGDLRMLLRNFEQAASSYAAAHAIAPTGILAIKIYNARKSGKLDKQREPLDQWIARHPRDDRVRMVLADAYLLEGNRRAGAAQYEAILASGNPDPLVLNNLAWTYFELADARAEATAKRSYDGAPAVAAFADTYGWILLNAGKTSEAVEILAKAVAAPGSDASTEFHYGVALLRAGRAEEGRRRLATMLAANPNFPQAEEARRLIDGEK